MFRPRRWNYCKLNTVKLTALAEELNWSETTRADSVEIQWANIKKCRTVATRLNCSIGTGKEIMAYTVASEEA